MRKLYRRLVPAAIQNRLAEYAKAALAALGTAVLVVNTQLPDYSDELQLATNVALAIATFLGVKQVRNRELP